MRVLEGPPLTEEEWAAAEKRFPRDDWRYEVGNGDTVLGYAEWLEHRILGSSDGGDRYFCLDSRGEAVFPGDRVTVLNKESSPLSFSGTVLRFNTDERVLFSSSCSTNTGIYLSVCRARSFSRKPSKKKSEL